MEKARLTVILGGVRSGKSKGAEERAIAAAKGLDGGLYYIACGKVTDEEMADRVRAHQRQRKQAERSWTTWEQPTDIQTLASCFTRKDAVLLDCLTTLVTNEWFAKEEPGGWDDALFQEGIKQKVKQGIVAIQQAAGSLVVVSNELSFEPIGSPLVFHYAKVLGELHQWLVATADEAVLAEHGCLIVKKQFIGNGRREYL
ncbi:bifunctional adenosylcobinamide kinase/adenosylcobinamide-phosphate guanylyltransferase [Bacillus thermotolerans]|uniref:Adenosylcobinamide kinase n=1 Tax=Bacillus thermotolerans TaxID=1221996 RepID=A0A0F5I3B1_BACTR|nr:bifunctional adenosylcobinamide kinase/adenosylcobinamide-phosphate guanylyltransferase [Bacillus thermotolerans]KKB36027.1 Adenosylcobinamide-phosphate guanylyltransferase [Bacillus thermotolerans]KKB40154.1 Adenosylcobinamide-phosphate guanylyltransferase [Bacillus thermotolerans]